MPPTLTLPRNPSYGYREEHVPLTESVTMERGYDQVVTKAIRYMIRAHLSWKALSQDELDKVLSFFQALNGSRGPFLWDPLNNAASPLSISPTLSQVAGGALGARTYFVVFTWYDATTTFETTESLRSSLAVDASKFIVVEVPAIVSGADSWRVHLSETSGAEKREATITGSRKWTQSVALAGTLDPPSANNLSTALTWLLESPLSPQISNKPGKFQLQARFIQQHF